MKNKKGGNARIEECRFGRDGRANDSKIPSNPWVMYKDSGWNGYADWLKERIKPAYFPIKKNGNVLESG